MVRVVIDVEMCKVRTGTGAFPRKNEIIQIGAVMMDGAFGVLNTFSTYMKPRFGRIDDFIRTLTGISERTLKDTPDIEEALLKLRRWIGGEEAVFYSWSPKDYFQIRDEIQMKCREYAGWDLLLDQANWIDYQAVFGARLGTTKLFRLAEALLLSEVDAEGRQHDGLDDALNTARMIAKLELDTDYMTLIERARAHEENQRPLTATLGDFLRGLDLESA